MSTELTAIIKCYQDTKSWFTRRQLLSLIADGRTKEQLLVRYMTTEVYWKKTIINCKKSLPLNSWTRDNRFGLLVKSAYKMHVSNSSKCGDHCIPFALGDDRCKHTHDLCCEQCEELKLVLEEIEEAATSEIAHYKYVYIPQNLLKICECNTGMWASIWDWFWFWNHRRYVKDQGEKS